MKRAFIVAPLSANVSPVTGSTMAVLYAQTLPLLFNLLIPVVMIAAKRGSMPHMLQHMRAQEHPGTQRQSMEVAAIDINIAYRIALNLNTCVQPDS